LQVRVLPALSLEALSPLNHTTIGTVMLNAIAMTKETEWSWIASSTVIPSADTNPAAAGNIPTIIASAISSRWRRKWMV
jgi:hypothetical protein